MANEKRLDLIDRNVLLEKVQFRLPIDNQNAEVIAGCVGITRRLIEDTPTVDAVEAVHGRREEIDAADYKCSRCGFRFTSGDPISMFQYCRCGAKMDGGNEDV